VLFTGRIGILKLRNWQQMLNRIAQLIAASALLTSASIVLMAQHGGKAEPMRIEFKHGTTSTTVSDKISGSVQAEYVLAAKKGQKLVIHLSSIPRRSAVFDLRAPENADLGLEYDANYDFSGTIPESGDYLITVVRPTTSPGTSRYRIVVSVR
jgi:hypothetical protein